MNKNINKCEISQKIVQIFVHDCIFLKVSIRCTDDCPSKGPNYVATILKSHSCVGRNICLFSDVILMFIHTVYDKIVLGIHIESKAWGSVVVKALRL